MKRVNDDYYWHYYFVFSYFELWLIHPTTASNVSIFQHGKNVFFYLWKQGITKKDFLFPFCTEILTWLEYFFQFLSPEKGSKMRMHTVLDPTAKTYDYPCISLYKESKIPVLILSSYWYVEGPFPSLLLMPQRWKGVLLSYQNVVYFH